jgi:hypothetical protein
MVMKVSGYAAHSATTVLAPWSFERRDPRPDDVAIDIRFSPTSTTRATNGAGRSIQWSPATRSSDA